MLQPTPQAMSSNKHSPGVSWVLGSWSEVILMGVHIGFQVFMVPTRTESLVWGGRAPNSAASPSTFHLRPTPGKGDVWGPLGMKVTPGKGSPTWSRHGWPLWPVPEAQAARDPSSIGTQRCQCSWLWRRNRLLVVLLHRDKHEVWGFQRKGPLTCGQNCCSDDFFL